MNFCTNICTNTNISPPSGTRRSSSVCTYMLKFLKRAADVTWRVICVQLIRLTVWNTTWGPKHRALDTFWWKTLVCTQNYIIEKKKKFEWNCKFRPRMQLLRRTMEAGWKKFHSQFVQGFIFHAAVVGATMFLFEFFSEAVWCSKVKAVLGFRSTSQGLCSCLCVTSTGPVFPSITSIFGLDRSSGLTPSSKQASPPASSGWVLSVSKDELPPVCQHLSFGGETGHNSLP